MPQMTKFEFTSFLTEISPTNVGFNNLRIGSNPMQFSHETRSLISNTFSLKKFHLFQIFRCLCLIF